MTDETLTQDLKEARQAITPYPITEVISACSLETAYTYQKALGHALQQEGSVGALAGYKLAVNGKPQMKHFGVSEPVSGMLFAQEISPSPAERAAAQFQSLCVEPEIAAILGPDVAHIEDTPDDDAVLACIESYAAAIEIIDMRGTKLPETTLSSAVALNVFNHGCVLGTARIAPSALSIPEITAQLSIDGQIVGQATDNAPQPPLEAVKWFISHAKRHGFELHPGMIILCGTHIPLFSVPDGATKIGIEMSGLGIADLTLH